jgi:hypothetical protein
MRILDAPAELRTGHLRDINIIIPALQIRGLCGEFVSIQQKTLLTHNLTKKLNS